MTRRSALHESACGLRCVFSFRCRSVFHETQVPQASMVACTLKIQCAQFFEPLYIRNPSTGVITQHRHPYPAFPLITVRTADPVILTLNARDRLGAILWGPLYQQFIGATMKFAHLPWTGFPTDSPEPPLSAVPSANTYGHEHIATDAPLPPARQIRRVLRIPRRKPLSPSQPIVAANLTPSPARKRKAEPQTAAADSDAASPKRRRVCPVPRRILPSRAAKTKAAENMAPKPRSRRGRAA